jgi:hypothetical protein
MYNNIFAYTAAAKPNEESLVYPEYISLNEHHSGNITLSVRSPAKLDSEKGYLVPGETVEVILPIEDMARLADSIKDYFVKAISDGKVSS